MYVLFGEPFGTYEKIEKRYAISYHPNLTSREREQRAKSRHEQINKRKNSMSVPISVQHDPLPALAMLQVTGRAGFLLLLSRT